jgi:hypothetical protein
LQVPKTSSEYTCKNLTSGVYHFSILASNHKILQEGLKDVADLILFIIMQNCVGSGRTSSTISPDVTGLAACFFD